MALTLSILVRERLVVDPEVEVVAVLNYGQGVLANMERVVEGALVAATNTMKGHSIFLHFIRLKYTYELFS